MRSLTLLSLLALTLSQGSFGDIFFEFQKRFSPGAGCTFAFADLAKNSIVYPETGGTPVTLLGAQDLSKIRLIAGDTRFPDPVSLFQGLLKLNPAARDPLLIEAVQSMKAPIDPSHFSVLCVPGNCQLVHSGKEAAGLHVGQTNVRRQRNFVPEPLDIAFRRLKDQVKELSKAQLTHQTVALRLPALERFEKGSNVPFLWWYATVAHEAVHVGVERTLIDWMNANLTALRKGKRPDDYFLRYVRFENGAWVMDEAFSATLHEGLAYSVTGSTYDLVAEATNSKKLDSSFELENLNNKPFDTYTGTRPAIKEELGLTRENWYGRSREIYADLKRTVKGES